MIALGIYGMEKWEQNFLQSNLYAANSPERQFFDLDEKLFPNGSQPMQVILQRCNYPDPDVGQEILDLVKDIDVRSLFTVIVIVFLLSYLPCYHLRCCIAILVELIWMYLPSPHAKYFFQVTVNLNPPQSTSIPNSFFHT
jgi:hypothetical protein